MPKDMLLCLSCDCIVNIIGPEKVDKEYCYTVATVQTVSEPPFKVRECKDTSGASEDCRDALNVLP